MQSNFYFYVCVCACVCKSLQNSCNLKRLNIIWYLRICDFNRIWSMSLVKTKFSLHYCTVQIRIQVHPMSPKWARNVDNISKKRFFFYFKSNLRNLLFIVLWTGYAYKYNDFEVNIRIVFWSGKNASIHWVSFFNDLIGFDVVVLNVYVLYAIVPSTWRANERYEKYKLA